MNVAELVTLLAHPLDVAVLLTDCNLDQPGPMILYANPAFERMSGYSCAEIVGRSPRMFQGPDTNQQVTRFISRSLLAGSRAHRVVQNYRKSGEPYLCELDVRPITDGSGRPLAFIAFEREVQRRRGRPSGGLVGRYRPIGPDRVAVGTEPFAPAPF